MNKNKFLIYLTHIFLIVFLVVYLIQKNYEFIGYTFITLVFFWTILSLHKKYKFPFIILAGFSFWIFLHMLGGSVINGVWIYGYMLINLIGEPYFILKYDQLIHFYCYLVIGAIMFYMTKKHIKKITAIPLFIIIMAAIGVGALNEIFEFTMVLFLENTGVGDYYNTSLDLVFNALGAIIGVLTANYYSKK